MTDYMYIGLPVTGPTDEVTRFREAVRGQNETGEEIIIHFSRLTPIPQEVTDRSLPKYRPMTTKSVTRPLGVKGIGEPRRMRIRQVIAA